MKNTFNKFSLLSFFKGCFISCVKYCLLPVYVFALVAIFHCCFIESASAAARDAVTKFDGGLLYGGNGVSDSFINFLVPKSVDRDNSFKFGQYDISKCICSGYMLFSSVSSDSKEVTRKESDSRCECGMRQCVDKELRQVVTSLLYAFAGCISMAVIIRLYYFFA